MVSALLPSPMLRRAFLKRMAFAAIATALPHIPLPSKRDEWETSWDPRLEVMHYRHVTYALGFAVSKELLEDDVYGDILASYKQLTTRFMMPLLPN